MKVPFLSLVRQNESCMDLLVKDAEEVIRSGWYIHGGKHEAFEKSYASYVGSEFCIGVANGLDALTLVLRAWLELGMLNPGDAVLVPANTYIASILAVSSVGLVPVFVEPDEETFNLSRSSCDSCDVSTVRAVLFVHLYGRCDGCFEVAQLCRERGWLLLEDAAQAHGARCRGIMAGNFGDAAAHSFYPSKNLGALGDAGAVTTNNQLVCSMLRKLRNYGSSKRYYNEVKGYNSRLDELQAAFLLRKLPMLDSENLIRKRLAESYLREISNAFVKLPTRGVEESSHVWHLFTLRVKERSQFQVHMEQAGIGTLIHYPVPPHLQQAYSELNHLKLPLTESIHNSIISVPLYPGLTKAEQDLVVCAINTFIPS